MELTRLVVSDVRCVAEAELDLGPGLNLITGGNGAGKTSLLEAVHLLGYGRSFRGRVRDGLVRVGRPHLGVFLEWRDGRGQARRAGLRHEGAQWEARLDSQSVPSLTELCAELAVVTFEPGSHALIAGGGEGRRRFLDWTLFHVEPSFLPLWRRYARALKQRNALLKTSPSPASLDAWERELADAGEPLTRLRQVALEQFEPILAATAAEFLPELGAASLDFQPGWRQADLALADALLLGRERDLATGFTSVGPHRADWRLGYAGLPAPAVLSRGQEKLTALACVVAQARAFADRQQEWPVVCLDDLASELDLPHQRRVLSALLASGAQVLLTATETPAVLTDLPAPSRMFHVEQGRIDRVG
ncbi:MAG: DNA replication/repair protein RecF [Arenimonas sp.]